MNVIQEEVPEESTFGKRIHYTQMLSYDEYFHVVTTKLFAHNQQPSTYCENKGQTVEEVVAYKG